MHSSIGSIVWPTSVVIRDVKKFLRRREYTFVGKEAILRLARDVRPCIRL
jgi:hypothetical protein